MRRKLLLSQVLAMKDPVLKLLYKSSDSPEWQKLNKYITTIDGGDPFTIHQSYIQMFQNLLRITYKDCPSQLYQFIMVFAYK